MGIGPYEQVFRQSEAAADLPVDKRFSFGYNNPNSIRQFVTILSLNKTREPVGALRPFLYGRGLRSFFIDRSIPMKKRTRYLAQAAIIAALYAVLTHFQNILLPGSATWAIQFRLSEALCILAFFTPGAAVGLAIGCLLFNLTFAAALPLDFLLGTLATYFSAKAMWLTRHLTVGGLPLLGLLMPALFNAVLVGGELAVYIGGGFWLNAVYVAIGEAVVLLTLGSGLYFAMTKRNLDTRLFGG